MPPPPVSIQDLILYELDRKSTRGCISCVIPKAGNAGNASVNVPCCNTVMWYIFFYISLCDSKKQSAAPFYWLQTQLMKLICCAPGLWCHISDEGFQGFACSVQSCSRSDPPWIRSQAAWSLGDKWHITARKRPSCRLSLSISGRRMRWENRAEAGSW